MFAIIDNPEFTHAVPVQWPVDGGHEVRHLSTRYRAVGEERRAALFALDPLGGEFLRAVVVRLENLGDAAGAPLAFAPAHLDWAIDMECVRLALLKGYGEAMHKARLGN